MRAVWKVLKWLLLALLAVVLAWLAFNNPLADSADRPRPAALIEQADSLAKEANAFYALQAMAGAQEVKPPSGEPWHCGSQPADCVGAWLERAPALREQMAKHAEFGRRCEAMAAAAQAYEEPTLQLQAANPAATPLPQFKPAGDCNRWLRAKASLAVLDHQPARAVALLAQADQMTRAMLSGSKTLISHAVAWSFAKRTWQTAAVLAQRDPALAVTLQPLLRSLEPEALSAQRWMAAESRFSEAITRSLKSSCGKQEESREELPRQGLSERAFCVLGLGLLPNKTVQDIDHYWLRALEATQSAGLGGSLSQAPLKPGTDLAPTFAWRNTVGQVLINVAQPQYAVYVAKQADVELVRQTVLLALRMSAEQVGAQRRFDWLQEQKASFSMLNRLRLDGDQLHADSWLSELGRQPEPGDLILVPLAKSQPSLSQQQSSP